MSDDSYVLPMTLKILREAGVRYIDAVLRGNALREELQKKVAKVIKDLTMFKIRNDVCVRTFKVIKDRFTQKLYAVYKCKGPRGSMAVFIEGEHEEEIIAWIRSNNFYKKLSRMWPVSLGFEVEKARKCIEDGGVIESKFVATVYTDMRKDLIAPVAVHIGKEDGEWTDASETRVSVPITIYAGAYAPLVVWNAKRREPVVPLWLLDSPMNAFGVKGRCSSTGEEITVMASTHIMGPTLFLPLGTSTNDMAEALGYTSAFSAERTELDEIIASAFRAKLREVAEEIASRQG